MTGPIPLITGPTAVGKTDLSVEIALALQAQIISADSRQIFKRLDVGTAKPDPTTLKRVKHHLIDELGLDDPISAGLYSEMAESRISDLLKQDIRPVVCGGSTLYIHALVNGIDPTPPANMEIRKALNERLLKEGPGVLYEELVECDPVFAATLDPSKSQRIIRGLEVFKNIGKPLSDYFGTASAPAYSYKIIVLDRDRSVLYDRINERVLEMVENGLVNEVAALMESGYDDNHQALRTIGYTEAFAHLRKEISREVMISLIQRNTRRYAKRQLTWFRRYENARWVNLDEPADIEALVTAFQEH